MHGCHTVSYQGALGFRSAQSFRKPHLVREEGPLGEVVAVPGPSMYCSAVLCSEGLSWPLGSPRAEHGGGDGEGDLHNNFTHEALAHDIVIPTSDSSST